MIDLSKASIRFQQAFKAQGLDKNDLTYTSRLQPWGSYVCIAIFIPLCLINGFEVFLPDSWSVSSFLSGYIGIPIFLILYFGHRLTVGRSDAWAMPLESIDLCTGLDELKADEEGLPPKLSSFRRVYNFIKKADLERK